MYIDFKKVTVLFPFVGSFLVFLGMLKLIIYYKAFNIEITAFLNFDEIITSFLNDLIIYGIMFLIGIVLNFYSTDKYEIDKSEELKSNFFNEKRMLKRLWIVTKSSLPYLVILNISILLIFFVARFKSDINFKPTLFTLIAINGLLFISFIFMELKRHYYLTYDKQVDPTYFNIFLMMTLFSYFIVFYTFAEISNVKLNKKYENVNFKLDDKYVQSDAINYYIGKTKNYLFFYSDKDKKTIVYPITRIKEIEFK